MPEHLKIAMPLSDTSKFYVPDTITCLYKKTNSQEIIELTHTWQGEMAKESYLTLLLAAAFER